MLNSNIDNFYQESLTWKDQLDFWKAEMDFVKDLLFLRVNPAQIGDEADKIDQKFTFFKNLIDQLLDNQLANHIKDLKNDPSGNSSKAEKTHNGLRLQLQQLDQQMMRFKKELIQYYKDWLDI